LQQIVELRFIPQWQGDCQAETFRGGNMADQWRDPTADSFRHMEREDRTLLSLGGRLE
jgi:hypothetical protein